MCFRSARVREGGESLRRRTRDDGFAATRVKVQIAPLAVYREAETEEERFCSQGGKREKMKTGRVGAERGKEEWGGEGGQWKEERGEWVQYPLAKGEGGKGLGGKG